MNTVIEESSLQNILKLKEMFDFYYVTRENKKDTIYAQFSYYYNWINTQLNKNKNLDKEGLLGSEIAMVKAQ